MQGYSEKNEESAIGIVVKGAELHLENDVFLCEEGQGKEESRPTKNETTVSCEPKLAPCSVLTLSLTGKGRVASRP